MWIFTNKGFISVVADRATPEVLIIRGRNKKQVKALFPEENILDSPTADYCCRVIMTKSKFRGWMDRQIVGLDYPNFKNSIIDDIYHDVCSRIWGIMMDYQISLKRLKKLTGKDSSFWGSLGRTSLPLDPSMDISPKKKKRNQNTRG